MDTETSSKCWLLRNATKILTDTDTKTFFRPIVSWENDDRQKDSQNFLLETTHPFCKIQITKLLANACSQSVLKVHTFANVANCFAQSLTKVI